MVTRPPTRRTYRRRQRRRQPPPLPFCLRASFRPAVFVVLRAKLADIDRAWEAVKHAKSSRFHTFIATSPIHMKFKLKNTRNLDRKSLNLLRMRKIQAIIS